MRMEFTKEEINAARHQELYDYLLEAHFEAIIKSGRTLMLKRRKSVKVRKGYSGFIDYKTGERGHSIDYLMRYLDYSFDEAVTVLLHIKGGEAIERKH